MQLKIGSICAVVLGLLISQTALFGQPPDTLWTRTYGGVNDDYGYSVQETQDGGFIIAGYTSSFGPGDEDVYLIRTDSTGNALWTKIYGGAYDDYGYSVQETQDSGFIIAGCTWSFGAGVEDVYLIRTDSTGDTLWTKTYGGVNDDYGRSVQETQDGGFIIAGYTSSFGPGDLDIYLIRTDSAGNTLWTKTYGGNSEDLGYSVREIQDGGFIIIGETWSFGAGNYDVYLIRTDSSGDTLWTKTWGGIDWDAGFSVQETQDSGYIIAGVTESFGPAWEDIYLIRTDSIGDTLWTKTYGGNSHDYGYSVRETPDGGFIVAGWTDSFGAGYDDVYLIRTDSLGDTVWTKTLGGTDNDHGYSVQQTQDGGYIVAGDTYSFGAGGDDVYLIRLGAETGIEETDLGFREHPRIYLLENPVKGNIELLLNLSQDEKGITIGLYNVLGQRVRTYDLSVGTGARVSLDTEGIPGGMYFLKTTPKPLNTPLKVTIIK